MKNKTLSLKKNAWLTLPVVATSLLFNPAWAAENKAEVLETERVDVISTTPLQSLATPVSEVPANVQVGTAKEIDQQKPLNLGEFLDMNLGSVNTSNGIGNPYQMDVSYRGFNASPILGSPVGMSVYLDGVRFNEPFGDIVNWDLIPANAIASINLIPGSNPLFGLNTLGGALAVNTKSGSTFPGSSITLTGGSWGRRAIEFASGAENKATGVDFFIAGNFFKEDGWREHSPSNIKQLFSKLGWHNETTDLDLSVALADNEMHGTQALPMSMWRKPTKAYTYPDSIENRLAQVSLKGSHFVTDEQLLAGNIYYRQSNARSLNSNAQCVDDEHCPISVRGTPLDQSLMEAQNVGSKTLQDGYGASVQYSLLKDWAGHKNNLTFGASADLSHVNFKQNSYEAELINYRTITTEDEPIDWVRLKTRSDYYGLYATDNFSFTDKLNMTVSARYNFAKVNLRGGVFEDEGSLTGKHQFKRLNPAIGFNYNPLPSLGFYAGYNEGMRAPSPIELSCADPEKPCKLPAGFNSDPPLDMVVAKTWEGGVRGRLFDALRWNASIYQTKTENDIQFIAATAVEGYFKNVGETQRRGIELGLNGKFEKLFFAVNYGFVDATYQSRFQVTSVNDSGDDGKIWVEKGNRMSAIARQTLKLRTSYEVTPSWMVGANVLLASSQYAHGDENNKDSRGQVPGYGLLNLDTTYKITPNWHVFAKVNNVLDNKYSNFGQLEQNIYTGISEQFRTPGAPRAGWIGLRWDIDGKQNASTNDKD